jgi:HdeA/HdeB family protein
MRWREGIFAAAGIVLLVAHSAAGQSKHRDYSKLTCGDFVGAGKDNMAVLLWWLHGYHAGKSGNIPFETGDPYAGRLGFYCGSHHADNLIETSERILTNLDHGI